MNGHLQKRAVGDGSADHNRAESHRRPMGIRFPRHALVVFSVLASVSLNPAAGAGEQLTSGPSRRSPGDSRAKAERRAEARTEHGDTPASRIRIITPEGVFLIYDAPRPDRPDGAATAIDSKPEAGKFVAYWNDFAARGVFVFTRPVFSLSDVGHALLSLQRDLSADIDSLAATDAPLLEALRAAEQQPEDSAGWARATRETLRLVMGFDAGPTADGDEPPILGADEPIDCVPSAATVPRGQEGATRQEAVALPVFLPRAPSALDFNSNILQVIDIIGCDRGDGDGSRGGPPGWSTIWRGWYDIMLMVHGAQLLAPIAEGRTCV